MDTGNLATFVGLAFAEHVREGLAAAGFGDLRFSHGYVFQHLVEGEPTIGELAARLQMTQQGASKAVAELEGLGYLERFADPGDARVRRVRFTARGRASVEAARRIRTEVDARLDAAHGAAAMAEVRRTLAGVLETLGGGDAVRARRVVPPH